MFYVKYLFLLQIINAKLQLNLHFTDVMTNNHENTSVVQQHCLYAGTNQPHELLDRHKSHFSLVAYCLSEPLTKFNIVNAEFFTNFTFVQLAEMNVTSEDLYLWSAPIDLIENYQYYLNENDVSLSTTIFYNCTWPRFGSQCQYELDNIYKIDEKVSSLKEYINTYHMHNEWVRTNWTCYSHLECIRVSGMRCLDWTDICDEKVDCLNNGVDEEHCWQLEINVCQDDEYRCYDGLCVPKYFLRTENMFSSRNCLHTSNRNDLYSYNKGLCLQNQNDFECHDSACSITFLTSSCFQEPQDLTHSLYSQRQTNVSNDCWSTFICLFRIFQNCSTNNSNELLLTIERTCPNMMFIPSIPILFGDIYITYIKDQSRNIIDNTTIDLYLCSNNSQYENYFFNHSKIIMKDVTCYKTTHWDLNNEIVTTDRFFVYSFGSLHSYNRFWNYSSNICKRSNMYQCFQSTKCISMYRILDDIPDCPYSDDEHLNLLENDDIQNQYKHTHFQCPNSNKSIPHWKLEDGNCDCDPENKLHCENYYFQDLKHDSLGRFCNGIIEYPTMLINGQNTTDETNCEHTPCYHPKYRCYRPEYCRIQNDEKQACKRNQTNNNVRTYSQLSLSSNSAYSFIKTLARCHYSINLHVWLDSTKQLSTTACLCSSNYYGDKCQYQNQRVIFRIAFDTSYTHFNTFFLVGISLIDDSNERIIQSHEQFTETKTDYCRFEHSLNLYYSIRPKNERKSYFIHVDIYERVSLKYRASYLFPVDFPFLPINLVSKVITIPRNNIKIKYCSNRRCNYHGKCIFYWNNSTETTFCQCNRGWSGKFCTIQYRCMCSSDSLCMGVSAQNRSICLCPINRLGFRCLINDSKCSINQNQTCQNGAQCIANNDISIKRQFLCICPKGFYGDLCEKSGYHVNFSFGKDFDIPTSIYVYGFTLKTVFYLFNERDHLARSIIYKRISKKRNLVQVSWKGSYELIFIENIAKKHYYLIQNYQQQNVSQTMMAIITSSDRCLHITEIANITTSNSNDHQNTDRYKFLCNIHQLNLSCFLEDIYLCTCINDTKERYAICVRYGKEFTNKCPDDSPCHFNGQCFLYDTENSHYWDGPSCLRSTWCLCNRCYYGTQCEFSTSGFSLSVDSILGYHVETRTALFDQSLIVQISVLLTIIYLIIGLINSLLCFITFKNPITHEVGCGLYLFGSSILAFIITILFALKMFILIFTQMYVVDNEIFLLIQCHSLDFLLRSSLYMDRWLSASVAIERAVCAIQGVNFNKAKSKRITKFVISFLLIFILSTTIHDSIYRKLIDDENEMDNEHIKRIWCISDYSSSSILLIYNNIIHTFHFFAPFICDLIASIVLITKKARYAANAQKLRKLKQHLREQFQEHKRLLFAPVSLVILAIPSLIITYVNKCMESIDDAWIYLIAYFILFIPPMLTFVIFVLPSKFYKNEFDKIIQQYKKNILRRFYLTS